MSRPFKPLPTFPNPIQWDVPGRIAELQAMINNPATDEPQKLNLQTAINLYHTKELPGRFKWIQDGKVVRHKDIDFQRPFWVEGYGQQLSSQIMIPATMPEPSFAPSQPMSKCPSNHQLAHRTMYTHYPAGQGLGHELHLTIRDEISLAAFVAAQRRLDFHAPTHTSPPSPALLRD
ncbi:uncharacterized protein CIMG_01996 [Coccidioides immitis RS]|uniref:Uncharacterized protein n=2 Tax=Coccidioides immitis TaxID=5501 RepID=A0A0E1RZ08_COCIM|nr:uncharacterized protein CIMG_01996 [Coccidioides immitis RS]EAS36642.2 hypothetical protein CIMG_01996 [Coccidioides immitis RS]KMU79839.1 hypothetical protein CISG_07911 [Coccidioides immitis RMSCC 3703]